MLNHQRLKFQRYILIFGLGKIFAIIALAWLPTLPLAVKVSTHSIVLGETQRSYPRGKPHEPSVPVPGLLAFHGRRTHLIMTFCRSVLLETMQCGRHSSLALRI